MRVAKKDDDGDLLVRNGLVAAFFVKKPYPSIAKAFGEVYALWSGRTPEQGRTWIMVGPDAEESKPTTPRSLTRAVAEFDPRRAKSQEMCALEHGGPQEFNPDHRFTFAGSRDIDDEETNFLEIRGPSEQADPAHAEDYVGFVRTVAEMLPYESGYASQGLLCNGDSQRYEFAKAARKWAFRHPGFDMPLNEATHLGLGDKIRGAFWLTFLGPSALKELGGEAALRKALPKDVTMEKVGAGVMLRAGSVPEIGDLNKGENVPLLRGMAKVLEPVTLFDDTLLNNNFVDESERARWERRHLT